MQVVVRQWSNAITQLLHAECATKFYFVFLSTHTYLFVLISVFVEAVVLLLPFLVALPFSSTVCQHASIRRNIAEEIVDTQLSTKGG